MIYALNIVKLGTIFNERRQGRLLEVGTSGLILTSVPSPTFSLTNGRFRGHKHDANLLSVFWRGHTAQP